MKTRTWQMPALVWLTSRFLAILAAMRLGLSALDPMTWSRFDSFTFLDIARRGYSITYHPLFANGHWSYWSGNTANWPLYAWLMRLLNIAGLPLPWCGLMITSAFFYGVLYELWNNYFESQPIGRAVLLLGIAGFFAGSIYDQAISPISMMTFEILLFLRFASQQRWKSAVVAGICCGMTHTESIFLPSAILLWALWQRSAWKRNQLTPLGTVASAPLIGFGLVLIVMRIQTGVWDSAPRLWAFHRYPAEWTLLRLKEMLYIPTLSRPTRITQVAVITQSASIAALCLAAGWRTLKRSIPIDGGLSLTSRQLLAAFALVYWIAPHLSPLRQSYYRAEALLLAAPILLIELPTGVLALLLLIWTPLAFIFADQFFRGILI